MANLLSLNGKVVGGGAGGSGGGHAIENSSGTTLTQRDTLQFAGYLNATDDSTNSRTVVDDTPTTITWDAWNQLTISEQKGTLWLITDVPGSTVSNEAIFVLKNRTLSFTNLTATITDARITTDTYPLVYYSDDAVAAAAGITSATSSHQITFTATSEPNAAVTCDIVFVSSAAASSGSAQGDSVSVLIESGDTWAGIFNKLNAVMNLSKLTYNSAITIGDYNNMIFRCVSNGGRAFIYTDFTPALSGQGITQYLAIPTNNSAYIQMNASTSTDIGSTAVDSEYVGQYLTLHY